MEDGHEVESLANGVAVADLLVAAVALVVFVSQHRHADLAVLDLVHTADLERPIARCVIDDEDLAIVLIEDRGGDPFQDPPQGRLGVIGDHEDQEALVGRAHRPRRRSRFGVADQGLAIRAAPGWYRGAGRCGRTMGVMELEASAP